MKMMKMGFDSNIREIRKNFSELKLNNETKVLPNNLKELLDYVYSSIGSDKSLTITPSYNENKQCFIVKI